MTTPTPARPPLWRVMHDAFLSSMLSGEEGHQGFAHEIRAVRDHLFPGGRPDPVGVSPDCLAIWDELTAEAERAERGDENQPQRTP